MAVLHQDTFGSGGALGKEINKAILIQELFNALKCTQVEKIQIQKHMGWCVQTVYARSKIIATLYE